MMPPGFSIRSFLTTIRNPFADQLKANDKDNVRWDSIERKGFKVSRQKDDLNHSGSYGNGYKEKIHLFPLFPSERNRLFAALLAVL
jgi:hypothetical protein